MPTLKAVKPGKWGGVAEGKRVAWLEPFKVVLGAEYRTVLMVVNSVCGCAAGKARPGVRLALKHSVRPAGSPAWRSVPRSVPVSISEEQR